MRADAAPILAIFEKKMRIDVPLFQRQYVWNKELHWEPLWEDISRKFSEYLEERKDAPIHFLGAMVLDQKQTPTTHVEKRQVIDGQQRLLTLQIFLAAFRDFCSENGIEDLAEECEGFVINKGMMAEPEIDKFKIWPTQLDRQQFGDIIMSGSRKEIEIRYPLTRRKYASKPNPRPRMIEAYLFLHDCLGEFFLGTSDSIPLANSVALSKRLEDCFQALKNALQVVVIDLDQADDAQVIFETLNARGEPLLPTDLLRNYIFLRAARHAEPQEELYDKYWRRFDDPFWREEIKQGRLFRPRSDLFMQHFLASRQTRDIPIKHLFVEYKFWIEKSKPFSSVREELVTLSRQVDDFRRIIEPKQDDPIHPLAAFLNAYDIRTAYPVMLTLLDSKVDENQWKEISIALESYMLRRAICGLTTKNYNRIFLILTRNLRHDGANYENIVRLLSEQTGESTEWPSDEMFKEAWQTQHVYQILNNPKIIHIYRRINETYIDNKMEILPIEGPLTVEHILPQYWTNKWQLPDGTKGCSIEELQDMDPDDPRVKATRTRNQALQTFGNLTILTKPLNSAASNSEWEKKKPELLSHSLLPINLHLQNYLEWDEKAIAVRSEELFRRAIKIWPRF